MTPTIKQYKKKSIGIKKINTIVTRWSYKLINNLEEEEGEIKESHSNGL